MKYLSYFLLVSVMLVSCQNKDKKTDETAQADMSVEYVLYEVEIEGMTCTGCEETIESGVTKVEGVGSVEANHTSGNAHIKFVEGKTDTTAVRKVIEASGYKVTGFKLADAAGSEEAK
ncbi:MAG: cation transporter [Marinilabiliaceae bacterium]|jgi:copper chaperone CopZ|nr:cation transporter [Marinilabiliaceae bacterium]